MNTLKRHALQLAGAILMVASSPLMAQTSEKIEEVLVKFKKGEIAQQKTPQYTVGGSTEKRFKPKDWLELEFELETSQPKTAKEKMHFHDEMTIKYYAFLANADEKKQKTLTADVNYVNVPVGEAIHSVVYLSPTTLLNLTGNNLVDKGMVKFWGAEAYIGGKLVGVYSSNNGPWWKHEKAPPAEPGRLQLRSTTPFAPLWADYYLEEKAK